MIKKVFLIGCLFLAGCFSYNVSKNTTNATIDTTKEVLLANPLNVYRNASNITVYALIQDDEGNWVRAKSPILIPTGWYIVSGVGIEE